MKIGTKPLKSVLIETAGGAFLVAWVVVGIGLLAAFATAVACVVVNFGYSLPWP